MEYGKCPYCVEQETDFLKNSIGDIQVILPMPVLNEYERWRGMMISRDKATKVVCPDCGKQLLSWAIHPSLFGKSIPLRFGCDFCKEERIKMSDILNDRNICTPIKVCKRQDKTRTVYWVERKKDVGSSACSILKEHHFYHSDDPERLSADFIKKLINLDDDCDIE